ncbi:3-deoxy-manno-octulosonate cytidylyltransferase [Suilimivivens aceti]|uniref:3-deoxy-manno-octulosonate cytidylyltransferase n=1 Tax=Suilimivivens aceti TaxID=2981774 RepID=A0ABT2SZH3_9FIRM|nr:3-deoxy-manno-octulosonate cytidylyltransferase [Suilimivivens aceti]MCU6743066.1 3-deoxy-manno-octulosonate cytidylyltransferase [Suilimivivens aceti]SCG99320.1 3-deoxy-manno-octulosonate cytidylyltransferase [uncultured Clostridium sp.]
MKIVAIIPARYSSTRLPGKPLKDICGKPMLWWVYYQVIQLKVFDDIICAIDDKRIQKVCQEFGINYIMTKDDHPNHISRIHEVSTKIKADYYICINGDEPLITKECILPILPSRIQNEPFFGGAMRVLTDPAETMDSSKIKLVVSDMTGRCLYMSRTPVPYPKGSLYFDYKKYIGVECFNKKALDFFVNMPMNDLERVEDIDHLRFLANGVDLHFNYVKSESISVDTLKDLEKVRNIISEKIKNGEIDIGNDK